MNVDLDDGAAVLGFIDDMDGFDVDHTGYRVAGGAQADGDTDFRLSIDSTGDYTEFRNSDGRSSANSVYSTPERLTARRSIPPLNGPPPPSSIE
ncbi:hypothetical protein LPJ66_012125 [Kickxella alabastrina]|uniref:Uncharacterized protein n=1 Tax=Kickxella alabastrina TaxID=61397 RepID=A0ACC1HZ78_9FUNG|nr:hypothetical protein LPJ66_012125 [Kickxella alabastrina]